MSITISSLHARQILDSRGNPTIEVDAVLSDNTLGRAAVPSGASTGSREAIERRDGDPKRFGGKSVQAAIDAVNGEINDSLAGKDPFNQQAIDSLLRELDGTPNKARLGANAILGVSLAVAKAAALQLDVPLYQHIASLAGTTESMSLPLPMMNIMNGGQHANEVTDFQEYMIVPVGASTFPEALEMGAAIFHALKAILKTNNYATTVGDEGGYAPAVQNGNREPLELIMQAITAAGYQPGVDIAIALDVAASEFYQNDAYQLRSEGTTASSDSMLDTLQSYVTEFPIISIEDGLDENDWDNWTKLTERIGTHVQIVGDDLLVTNPDTIREAIDKHAANAVLIKPNQIGTLSETIEAVRLAKAAGWNTIVSHRSGETEDTTIAHIAVGIGAGQIKTGSLSRSERIAKYNELLRIAEDNPHLSLANPFKQGVSV